MNAIHTDNAPAAIGPYSQAIDSGAGLVFVSGQIPVDPASGSFPEGGVKGTDTPESHQCQGHTRGSRTWTQ